jgi:archaetidylinositol phosphate synthase
VKGIVIPIVKVIARTGVRPNHITILGLIFAIIFILFIWLKYIYLSLLFLILSNLMDGIDGELARLTNSVSASGAFLDSTIDRLEDSLYLISFIFLNVNAMLISFLIAFSITISYIRAKAESLKIQMEGVGIIERGERLLFILIAFLFSIIGLNDFATYILLLLLVLSIITVYQRIRFVMRKLNF